MRRLIYIALAICIAVPCTTAAEEMPKSKKKQIEYLKEKNRLLQIELDSLRAIINGGGIELSSENDTTAEYNGNLNYEDWPEMESATPGANSDSLLAIWYEHRNSTYDILEDVNMDSVVLTSNIPDSIYIQKLKRMNSIIPIPYNSIVKNNIILYTEKRPALAKRVLGLSQYYLPEFEEIMDYYGLPLELKAMAIIESALNPFAVSRTRAKGIWQFMYRTALQYGLTINSYVDERLDPIKSANAAAKYLRDSYTVFGDWALAIASYNCGLGNVNKAIKRAGGSKEFWKVYPYLPRETRGYVPGFVGALYLLNYYKEYNITPYEFNMPSHVDTVGVKKNVHFEQISAVLGIPVDQLKELNPQYIKNIIPGNEKQYTLRLPYNYTTAFIEKENEIYTYKDSLYFGSAIVAPSGKLKGINTSAEDVVYHRVRSGETLGGIAARYHVSVSKLKRWNSLKSDIIRKGQRLIVNQSAASSAGSSKSVSQKSSNKKESGTTQSGDYQYYTIRRGDTLYGIAIQFNTSLNSILKLNGLKKNSKIYPGKKIKVKRL